MDDTDHGLLRTRPDSEIGLYIEPDAIHVMKKSEFSDMFGDYSSYSEEFDTLSVAEEPRRAQARYRKNNEKEKNVS